MKAILVIDIADDVAETYKDFTVDYDLRGTPKEDKKANESIKYVEDVRLRPLPRKAELENCSSGLMGMIDTAWMKGYNECLEEIMGETK